MTDRNEILERLIEAARLLGITRAKKVYGVYTIDDGKVEGALHESIDKYKAALAQPEIPMSPEHLPQYIATNNIKPTTEGGGGAGGAQPEPKPVAKHVCNLWINPETSEYEVDRCTHPINEVIPVYTALAQPEQEFKYTPYGLRSDENGKLSIGEISQREWVGLTDREIHNLWMSEHSATDPVSFSRIIEAKLKERNFG